MLHKINVAASWQRAREQFAAVVSEHDSLKLELEWTKRSLAETREALHELSSAVLARQHAEAEVRGLYREREIARAKATERDITQPLN